MARADLHVHSQYSKHPSEWFLQRIGTRESYTDIEELYHIAKKSGMDFVTITDHNTIDGVRLLNKKYPDDTFVSSEFTVYFPEDGCKIHLLAYDISDTQFTEMNALRKDIYALRDFIKKEHIAYSVAHATYSVNRRLSLATIEKLVLLFDVFEGINGARNAYYNQVLREVLSHLTPDDIERLHEKYGIEPMSTDPWVKGFTGGSDDHAGLFIGQTATIADCRDKEEFIQMIRDKRTTAFGRTNDYKSFAFTIYKIAYDFSKNTAEKKNGGIWDLINTTVFEGKRLDLKSWLAMQKFKRYKNERDKLFVQFLDELINDISYNESLAVDEKIQRMYDNIAALIDNFFIMVVQSLTNDLKNGEPGKMFRTISAALPVFFLSAPFISSLKHLYLDRDLIQDLRKQFIKETRPSDKRVLWFTDTFNDLNGVAVTLNNIVAIVQEQKLSVKFVVSIPEKDALKAHKHSVINLPHIYSYTPEFYPQYTLRIPSLLKSIAMIYEHNPSEIIVSTPGPVGLLGLLLSRLFGIPCTGVYHTDFTRQTEHIITDEGMAFLMERYIKWFYSLMDEIRVPTKEYINILVDRGYEQNKMKLFKRGIDTNIFRYADTCRTTIQDRYKIPDGFTLLWSGRVSKDKRIDVLLNIYARVLQEFPDTNLIIAGDGPDLEALRGEARPLERVFCLGRLPREALIDLYSFADLFVFPSTVDTFGMVAIRRI